MKLHFLIVACLPLMAMSSGATPMPSDCQFIVDDLNLVSARICFTALGDLGTVSPNAGFNAPVLAHAGAVTLVDADGNAQTIPWVWREGNSPCNMLERLESVFPTCYQNAIIPETDLFAATPNEIPLLTYCLQQAALNVDVTADGTRDYYVPAGG